MEKVPAVLELLAVHGHHELDVLDGTAMVLRIFSGSLVLSAFRACQAEKAVQHGDPMTI